MLSQERDRVSRQPDTVEIKLTDFEKIRRTNMKKEPKFKTIPLWKWILLYFCPAHIGFDTEGDVACVHYAKMLFKTVYIMREDYFCISTGNLLRTRKLTRNSNKTEKIDKVVRGKLWIK